MKECKLDCEEPELMIVVDKFQLDLLINHIYSKRNTGITRISLSKVHTTNSTLSKIKIIIFIFGYFFQMLKALVLVHLRALIVFVLYGKLLPFVFQREISQVAPYFRITLER